MLSVPAQFDVKGGRPVHTDIPTRADLEQLLSFRGAVCVSIYLPTAPEERGGRDRLEFKNLAGEALEQLTAASIERDWINNLGDVLDDLADDDAFWARQAHSLAVFATPWGARTFQVANRLSPVVEVSDRFHVKPLLRSATFPQAAFVLALSQNAARLVEVSPDAPPAEVSAPGMPSDAASAVGKASIADRSPDRRLQGSEGQKVRLRQYARRVWRVRSSPATRTRRPTASWLTRAAAYSTGSTPTSSGSCAPATSSACRRAERATTSRQSRAPRRSGRSTRRSWTSTRPCPASSTRRTAR
jgi:hypothetical protein